MISKNKYYKGEGIVQYLHPSSCFPMDDNIIPMGVIALMNSLNCEKEGKFFYEVSKKDIKNAKVVAMDLHWYFHLYGVKKAADFIKRVNPDVCIIVGGYTSTIFAEILVERFNIDFVIKGDAEYSFPLLVKKILHNEELKDIPNIVSRDFVSPFSYTLTQEDYDNSDYITCDWFKEYKRKMLFNQRYDTPTLISPWIPTFRGCIYNCEFCYGNPKLQMKLSGRGIIARSPDVVKEDLMYYSNDKDIKTIHIIGDFIDTLGEDYAKDIFSTKYDLNLYYEFFNLPDISTLKKMLNSFNKCFFAFSASLNHGQEIDPKNYEHLKTLLNYIKDKNIGITTLFLPLSVIKNKYKEYLKEIYILRDKFSLRLVDNSDWALIPSVPYPKEEKKELEKEFKKFYKKSKQNLILGMIKKKFSQAKPPI